jgi:hypothetical protein
MFIAIGYIEIVLYGMFIMTPESDISRAGRTKLTKGKISKSEQRILVNPDLTEFRRDYFKR